VENSSVCSKEWIITPLAMGIEPVLPEFVIFQGVGSASQTLDSTSILQDF